MKTQIKSFLTELYISDGSNSFEIYHPQPLQTHQNPNPDLTFFCFPVPMLVKMIIQVLSIALLSISGTIAAPQRAPLKVTIGNVAKSSSFRVAAAALGGAALLTVAAVPPLVVSQKKEADQFRDKLSGKDAEIKGLKQDLSFSNHNQAPSQNQVAAQVERISGPSW